MQETTAKRENSGAKRPILIVPYVWIGDFVRCHSVVRLLRAAEPDRRVDIVSSTLCAPLADYMPGVRRAIVADLPRRRLGLTEQLRLSVQLRRGHYSQALIMSRKWKAALAPTLAGIPLRTGFVGEARFGFINDLRFGERKLSRMIDQMSALALPKGATLPPDWPLPELKVPPADVAAWRARRGLGSEPRPIVALSPGAVGLGKAWPPGHYADLALRLTRTGAAIWVLGGPNETPIARDIVAAALGTPTVAIFGPTSPWHWKPLNRVSAILEPEGDPDARARAHTEGNDAVAHHRTADVPVGRVETAVRQVLAAEPVN